MNAFSVARAALLSVFPDVDVSGVEVRGLCRAVSTGKLHVAVDSRSQCGARSVVEAVTVTLDDRRLDALCLKCSRGLDVADHLPRDVAYAAAFVVQAGCPLKDHWAARLRFLAGGDRQDLAVWAGEVQAWARTGPQRSGVEQARSSLTAAVLAGQLLPAADADSDIGLVIAQQLRRCRHVHPFGIQGPGDSELAQLAREVNDMYMRLYADMWNSDRPMHLVSVPSVETHLADDHEFQWLTVRRHLVQAHGATLSLGAWTLMLSPMRAAEAVALIPERARGWARLCVRDFGPVDAETLSLLDDVLFRGRWAPVALDDVQAALTAVRAAAA